MTILSLKIPPHHPVPFFGPPGMCLNIRKCSFGSRVVNVWNSLPDYVVEADSVNAFKNRLDKHWTNQDVVYDYNSDLTGTGGLPVCA